MPILVEFRVPEVVSCSGSKARAEPAARLGRQVPLQQFLSGGVQD